MEGEIKHLRIPKGLHPFRRIVGRLKLIEVLNINSVGAKVSH